MKQRKLIASVSLTLAALAAHAGTVKFHTGDATRPTAGVDFWNYTSTGTVLSLNAQHHEFPYQPTGQVSWEVQIDFSMHHQKNSAMSNWPFTPAQGTDQATAQSTGDVFWWIEYVPANPLDLPNWVLPCYADVNRRGTAGINQYTAIFKPGRTVTVDGETLGDGTILTGSTLNTGVSPVSNQYDSVPSYETYAVEFHFAYDPVLGKWLGKPIQAGGADNVLESLITISGSDAKATNTVATKRNFRVLRVRTPDGQNLQMNIPF